MFFQTELLLLSKNTSLYFTVFKNIPKYFSVNLYHHLYKKIILFFLCLIFSINSFAGPPFLTNDPEPIPEKTWKLYLFSMTDSSPVATTAAVPAIQFKYGAVTDLEIQTIVSGAEYSPTVNGNSYGLSDSAFVIKYRFVHETKTIPQIAFHPFIEFPTGNEKRNLGKGHFWYKIPFFAQKSWGPWTTYGGGGYVLNAPASGNKNYFYGSWEVQRDITKTLLLGGEIFSQGRSSKTIPAFTILNFGTKYKITKNSKILFSLGHSIIGQPNTVSYLGIDWTGSV